MQKLHQLRPKIPIPSTTKPILQRHNTNNKRIILLRNQTKIHTQKNNPMPQIPEQETNPILKLKEIIKNTKYIQKCDKCQKRIEVRVQEDNNAEYLTDIYVKCQCGNYVKFILPVN